MEELLKKSQPEVSLKQNLRPKGSGRSIKDPSYISFLVLSPPSSILPHKKQNTHHNKHAQNDDSLSLSQKHTHTLSLSVFEFL
jgi:hypothetical protein